MTVALNQEVIASGSSGTSPRTLAISNTQAGATIAGFVHCASGQTLTGITDTQGNTYTVLDTITEPSNLMRLTSYYANNIVGGAAANTLSFAFSATATNYGLYIAEIRGAKASALDGHTGQNQGGGGPGTGTDAIRTGTASNASQPALMLAMATTGAGSGTISAGTGFTLGQQQSPWISGAGVSMATETKYLTTTAAQEARFTQSSAFRTLSLMMMFDELSSVSPSPSVGSLSIQGLAPTLVNLQQTVTPGVGALALQGLPVSAFDGNLRPAQSALTINGLSPSILIQQLPSAGAMTPAALQVQGLAPTVITQRIVQPLLPSGDGFENDLRPTVLTEWTAKPAPAQLTLGGTQPQLVTDGSARVSPGVAQLSLQGLQPFVASAANPTLQPSRANLDLIGLAPDVIVNWIISPADPDAPIQVIGLQPTLRGRLTWHAPGMSGTVEWHTPS